MAAEETGTPFGLAPGRLPSPEEEAPAIRRERGARALSLAARLLAGAITFFFLAFAFAYVYLKTSNIEGKWRPANVHPVQAWGVAFVVCLLISAAAMIVASRSRKAGRANWVNPAIGALIFGLLAIIAQIIEYTAQGFGPSNYAYASTFIAWTGFFLLVALAGLYWIEIVVVTEIRELSQQAALAGEGTAIYEDPDRLLPRGVEAAAFFWTYLVGTGVVMWVLLYLVK
jgi:heme/copper-type cytochrome/quinol oxidase subunit 3